MGDLVQNGVTQTDQSVTGVFLALSPSSIRASVSIPIAEGDRDDGPGSSIPGIRVGPVTPSCFRHRRARNDAQTRRSGSG